MKRAKNRIIVTSERVNNYGFRVLTDGIDLSQYEKNPLMLWMHVRPFGSTENQVLALGNVIELKRENHPEYGKVITGQPMFDDTDDFAMRIFNKYDNGTYRMASSGLRPIEWSDAPEYLLAGQRGATLTLSLMEEISLCDLGGNDDALTVALYDEAGELIQLSQNGENAAIPAIKNPFTDMSKIELTAAKAAVMLGLKEVSTADEFETKVIEYVQLAHSQKIQIETLSREKSDLQTKLDNLDKEALKNETNVMLSAAVNARKITQDEVAFYEGQVNDRAGLEKVKLHLDAKGGSAPISQIIPQTPQTNIKLYAGKTWKELDRQGKLVQLKNDDFNYFKQLYQEEFGKEYKG